MPIESSTHPHIDLPPLPTCSFSLPCQQIVSDGLALKIVNTVGDVIAAISQGDGIGVDASAQGFGAAVNGFNAKAQAGGMIGCFDPKFGQSAGVFGRSHQQGVVGLSTDIRGTGTYGFVDGATEPDGSHHGFGVRGETQNGVGVQGQAFGHGLAGRFIGDVEVTGSVQVLGDIVLAAGDCAEDFNVCPTAQVEPGTVVILDGHGALHESTTPYDKRVVGVVSGAGTYKPAMILDRHPAQGHRAPLALIGKVCCKVDARFAPIEVGDLLTSSTTPGHAMKATDPSKAFGAVIGKALSSLQAGTGLIPILVALQ
jgi:hypothetical protein